MNQNLYFLSLYLFSFTLCPLSSYFLWKALYTLYIKYWSLKHLVYFWLQNEKLTYPYHFYPNIWDVQLKKVEFCLLVGSGQGELLEESICWRTKSFWSRGHFLELSGMGSKNPNETPVIASRKREALQVKRWEHLMPEHFASHCAWNWAWLLLFLSGTIYNEQNELRLNGGRMKETESKVLISFKILCSY